MFGLVFQLGVQHKRNAQRHSSHIPEMQLRGSPSKLPWKPCWNRVQKNNLTDGVTKGCPFMTNEKKVGPDSSTHSAMVLAQTEAPMLALRIP